MIRRIGVFAAWSVLLALDAAADEKAGIPQLESVGVGWSKVSDDFQPPELGPGPVTYDRDRPYIPNNNEGRQVTFRIADLTNPILKPWVIEKMREQNALAAAGKAPLRLARAAAPAASRDFLSWAASTAFFPAGEERSHPDQRGRTGAAPRPPQRSAFGEPKDQPLW